MKLLEQFLRWVDETRANRMVDYLKPPIVGSTLDVGCWNGGVVHRLGRDPIIGMDVADPLQPQIEVRKFDGRNVHFVDCQFDTVSCCTALHHVDDQSVLLLEMKRTGKRLVILDDGFNDVFGKRSVIFLRAISSRLVGMPYQISGFRSDQQWRTFFEVCRLKIVVSSGHPGVQPIGCVLRHNQYVLEGCGP